MSSNQSNCRNGSFKETRRKNKKQFLDDHTSTTRGMKRFNQKLRGDMPNSNPFHQLLNKTNKEKN